MAAKLQPPETDTPASIEAETGLLACCLIDESGDAVSLCQEAGLTAEAFFKGANQLIWTGIEAVAREGHDVEEVAVGEMLKTLGTLDDVGGIVALSQIADRIDTAAHAPYWLKLVLDRWARRRLIRAGRELMDKARDTGITADQLQADAEELVFRAGGDMGSAAVRPIAEAAKAAGEMIGAFLRKEASAYGILTGFTDLDRQTFGLHNKDMVVLAARPSMGKTALALNIAEHIAMPSGKDEPHGVIVFSLEMGAEQLALRLICARARVYAQKVKEGYASQEERARMTTALRDIRQSPMWIDDSAGVTIAQIRARARRIVSRFPVRVIVVDYLQLIAATDRQAPREQQVAEISGGLKAMAKELAVPVLILSQLNRDSEREKRKPRLSDLRESGSIEQDADVVMILAHGENGDNDASAEATRQTATRSMQLIVAKQRNGPVGDVPLTFVPEFTRFENYQRS